MKKQFLLFILVSILAVVSVTDSNSYPILPNGYSSIYGLGVMDLSANTHFQMMTNPSWGNRMLSVKTDYYLETLQFNDRMTRPAWSPALANDFTSWYNNLFYGSGLMLRPFGM